METIYNNLVQLLTYDPQSPIIFSSGLFLVLFVGFTLVYYLLHNTFTPRILFVTLFSYYFYYKSSGVYFILLAVVTLSDYLIAKAIHNSREENADDLSYGRGYRKMLVLLSLAVDLGFLGYFKYANFFGANFALIVGQNFQPWDIFLPVGISFFTFQSLSYTIDVYRGELRPLDSLLDYAFYVSFFPQLVAGPIVRARDFAPQIRKPLVINNRMIAMGVYLIVIGLFKKAVISDYISINFVDRVFDNPLRYTGVENLFGLIGYAMQLYCDFSGYSDMAIGIALLLGFRFPINFNAPFKADSVSDFWRRWHISLSFWLRDYVYIPLGGNRKGKIRQYVNLFLTMLIGGFWHGAGFTYVIWGAIHGVALVVHKMCMPWLKRIPDNWAVKLLSGLLTFTTVMLAFVFFRAESVAEATTIIGGIFTNFDLAYLPPFVSVRYVWCIMLVLLLVAHFVPCSIYAAVKNWFVESFWLVKLVVFVIVVQLVLQFATSDVTPFIYAQY